MSSSAKAIRERLPHDGHPSPQGYDVAAEFLADGVQRIESLGTFCSAAEATRRRVRRVVWNEGTASAR